MTFKEIKSIFTSDFSIFDVNGYHVPIDDVSDDIVVKTVDFEERNITLSCSISTITKPETKFYFSVGTSGDTYSSGYVLLTQREADIVAFATNYDNWKNSFSEGYCGSFYIENDHPIPVDKFENEMKWKR